MATAAAKPSSADILEWAGEVGYAIDERSARLASLVIGAVTYAAPPDFKAVVQAAAAPPPKPNRDVAEVDGQKKLGLKVLSDGVAEFWSVGPAPCWRAPCRLPCRLWALWPGALPWWLVALYLFAAGCFAVWVRGMGGLGWAGLGSTTPSGPLLYRLTYLAVPLPSLIFFRCLPASVYGWRWGWRSWRWGWRSDEHAAIFKELREREKPRLGPGVSFFCGDSALVSPSADYTVVIPPPPRTATTERQPLVKSPVVYKGYIAMSSLYARGFMNFGRFHHLLLPSAGGVH